MRKTTRSKPSVARVLMTGLLVSGFLSAATSSLRAQEGTTAATLGGVGLGLYSGSFLGLGGGVVPCSQVVATLSCARLALAISGVAGGLSGGLLGDADAEAVEDAWRDAAYGALVGAAIGVVVKQLVYYYDWTDVIAIAALGAAIGPVWPGTAVGLAAGAGLGFGLYLIHPTIELTDAVALAGVGLAVGGLVAWALKASDARSGSDGAMPGLTVDLLTLRF